MLVVALIIGLAIAVVAVRLQPDDRQILRDEALRLSALLTQARDEAIASGSSLAWRGDPTGYGFLRRDANRLWAPFPNTDIFRRRDLRAPLELSGVEISGRAAATENFLVFSPSGMVLPFRITLTLNGERVAVRADYPTRIEIDSGDAVNRVANINDAPQR